MKKINVLKKNKDFSVVMKNGQFVKNNCFIVYYSTFKMKDMEYRKNVDYYRIGISVSKKIGNAVIRNYYKRVIRDICDNYKNSYSNFRDYIIIMRKGCTDLSFSEINENLGMLFNKIEKEK